MSRMQLCKQEPPPRLPDPFAARGRRRGGLPALPSDHCDYEFCTLGRGHIGGCNENDHYAVELRDKVRTLTAEVAELKANLATTRSEVNSAAPPEDVIAPTEGTYADGFIDGRELGYASCGSCQHLWEAHDGECKAYMTDGSICGCRKIVVNDGDTIASLRETISTLQESLRKLSNEASGFISMADPTNHGYTNMRVLQLRIDEAQAVLAPKPVAPDTERKQALDELARAEFSEGSYEGIPIIEGSDV